MIEIDSRIINPDVLLDRVKASVKMKNISEEFFGSGMAGTCNSEEATVEKIRSEMGLVYYNLQAMNATWEIRETPITSHRPVIGKAIVFGKKVFRKLTRWLFRTYYEQQTNFNGAATRTISDMIRVQELLISNVEQGKLDAVAVNVNKARIQEETVRMYQNLQAMNAAWEIHEVPITSHRPVIGKAIVFGKKTFRKLTRWLFRPYYEQQTHFNGAVTRTVSDMIRVQELLISAYAENGNKE